ncbi:hypothetical protein TRVL_08172 [Trypanosoma vivax]|nr:hypothetical protein TRVL_08172 [Trypanosoma vivax]
MAGVARSACRVHCGLFCVPLDCVSPAVGFDPFQSASVVTMWVLACLYSSVIVCCTSVCFFLLRGQLVSCFPSPLRFSVSPRTPLACRRALFLASLSCLFDTAVQFRLSTGTVPHAWMHGCFVFCHLCSYPDAASLFRPSDRALRLHFAVRRGFICPLPFAQCCVHFLPELLSHGPAVAARKWLPFCSVSLLCPAFPCAFFSADVVLHKLPTHVSLPSLS